MLAGCRWWCEKKDLLRKKNLTTEARTYRKHNRRPMTTITSTHDAMIDQLLAWFIGAGRISRWLELGSTLGMVLAIVRLTHPGISFHSSLLEEEACVERE
jgi:hypothetical protein